VELLLVISGIGAGLLGALLGLGGGVILVPLLTLVFDLPLTAAFGTSLVCVVATSIGAAARYLALGRTDVRLGVALAGAGVVGAAAGGVLAGVLSESVLSALFAVIVVYAGLAMAPRALAARGDAEEHLPSVEPGAPDGPGAPAYRSHRLPTAVGGSVLAGGVAGLLGVGGGVVNVPILHLLMGAPMAVAVATSNLMIGVTAASAAYVYLFRGDVEPTVAGPVVLGVLGGAAAGARIAPRVQGGWLTAAFLVVLGYVAVRMALRAVGGG